GSLRPTSDRARETLFNILVHGGLARGGASPLDGARVLDVFAGTGALGLEALSRGAAHATFIEAEPGALECLRRNVSRLGEEAHTTLLRADAARPPPARGAPASIAFLDPPYESGLAAPALAGLAAQGWLAEGAISVVELRAREPFDPPAGFTAIAERRCGKTRFVFLRWPAGEEAPASSQGTRD
ncbi:MAG: 16S rRNA (guanine(966)-N(2))-methyltransferase RsmD, partial [Alphaproteobacteria bacterium]